MATYYSSLTSTNFGTVPTATPVAGQHGVRKVTPRVVEAEFDFASVTAPTSSDVIKMIAIPPGTVVLWVGVQQLTTASGSGTIACGDAASAGRYVAAAAPPAANAYMTSLTEGSGAVTPYSYAAASDIRLTVATNTVTAGKTRVVALLMDVSNEPGPTASWTP